MGSFHCVVIVLSGILTLTGCASDDFRSYFQLGDFRLMAIVAQPPQLGPQGGNVTLIPWISDINAGGRVVKLEIAACPDPGVSLGADPTCVGSSRLNGTIAPYPEFQTSTLGPIFSGPMPAITINVPNDLLVNRSAGDRINGVDYLVTLDFTVGDQRLSSYKRVGVSEQTPANSNPKIDSILVNGATATQRLADGDAISLTVASGFEPQSYQLADSLGAVTSATETYRVSWFVWGAKPRISRTDLDQASVVEAVEVGQMQYVIYAVLRDDRGGVDVTTTGVFP